MIRSTLFRALFFAFSAGMLAAVPAAAQQPYGSVGGRTVDTTGLPLPGVAVSLAGPAMLGTRATVTDSSGRFRFAPVPPGTAYVVAFELSGFAQLEQTGVIVNVGRETTVGAEMAPAQFMETLEVSAERIVVDATKSTIDTSVEWKLADTLATPDRNFQGLMQLAPGVEVNSNQPRVHGGGPGDNLYLVDGVNTTDPRNEGFGTFINYDAIAEAQIQTAAFAAEYGRVIGGLINLVTKSGGNEVHGTVRYVQRDEDWNSAPEPGSTAARDLYGSLRDLSATLGGPLQRDRLWYFVSYERLESEAEFPRATDWTNTTTYQDAADYWKYIASAKLSWQPSASHHLMALYNEDPDEVSNCRGFLNSGVAPESEWDCTAESRNTTLQWTGVLSASSFLEARVALFWLGMKIFPTGPLGPEPSYYDYATGYSSGTASWYSDMDYHRDTATVVWNQSVEAGAATHQLKAGVEAFEGESTDFDVACPTGGFLGPGECIGLWYGEPDDRAVHYNRSGSFTDTNSYTALFIQDAWRVGNLTLNLGLRAEKLKLTTNVGKVVADFGFEDQLAPRLGFALDIAGNSLHGSASRFYDLVNGLLTYQTNETTERVAYYLWGPAYGLGEDWVEVADFPLNSEQAVDPGLEPTYTDELTLGYDHRLSEDYAASVTLIWREQNDAIENIDAGILGDPVADDGSFYFTNVPGLWKKYEAIELALKKRLSADRLQFLASWTHSFKNEGYSTYSQTSAYGNSSVSVVNRWGRTDTDDLVKFAGSYAFPFRLTIGLTTYYYTGKVWAAYKASPTPKGRYAEYLEPVGSRDVGSQWSMDLHLEQAINLGKGAAVSLYADAINLTNNQAPTARWGNVGNPATFGTPSEWQTPRRYQLGAKLEF